MVDTHGQNGRVGAYRSHDDHDGDTARNASLEQSHQGMHHSGGGTGDQHPHHHAF